MPTFIGGGLRVEKLRIHSQLAEPRVTNAPLRQKLCEGRRGDDGRGEAVVKFAHVAAGYVACDVDGDVAEKFVHRSQVSLGEMRVVESHDGNPERVARGQGLPRHLVGVTGLDNVRTFFLEDILDRGETEKHAIARGARNER